MPSKNSTNKQKIINGIGVGILALVTIILIFIAGFHFGRRERFLPFWPQNLSHNHEQSRQKFGRHGIVGSIESIDQNTVSIKLRNGDSKKVLTDNNTTITKDGMSINFSDLKVGDRVLVLGNPTNNELQARALKVIENYGQNNKRY